MPARILAQLAFAFALTMPRASAGEVTFDWVTVGDSGNACDTQAQGCFGAVAEVYRISRYEVTNSQYVEFLNAVAATDTNGLYNNQMTTASFGGITRSGGAGSYSYSATPGREDKPVNYVSFWDATRFANWLHNGQPTGAQDNTTTEDGAYTLTPTGIANNTVTRNAEASVFVTSEDEWYKAAYYKGGGTNAGYWDYPAGEDSPTTCALPGATANTANCNSVVGDLTDVGSYPGAGSPSGTFDQGGNSWEWHETIMPGVGQRGTRGGGAFSPVGSIPASARFSESAGLEWPSIGIRIASTVPAIPALRSFGMAVLCVLLGAVAWWGLGTKWGRLAGT